MTKTVLFCFVVFLVFPSFAKVKYFYDKALPVGKTAVIKIVDFDDRLGGVYQAINLKQPGEGYFYMRAQNLAKSVKGFNSKAVKRSPASIVGKKFKLSRELETVIAPAILPED